MKTIDREQLISFLRDFAAGRREIVGPEAQLFGTLCHVAGLDSSCQWGNLYYRCECGRASDVTGIEDFGGDHCECEAEWVGAANLHVSEGWLERFEDGETTR